MLRNATVEVARSTIQMAGLPPEVISADAGMTTSCSPASFNRPDTTEPSSMPGGGLASPTRTVNVPVIGLACGETSRTSPVALTRGSSVRATSTGVSARGDTQHLRRDLEHRVGAAGARDAQDHLAALDDLAGLGAARGDRAVELGREHGEADEVLRHLHLRLGALDLRLGRAERRESRVEVGPGREPLADQRLAAAAARRAHAHARRAPR